MEKMRLLNTYVNNVTLDEAVEFLLQKIREQTPAYVVEVNVDVVVKMETDLVLRQITDNADLTLVDGQPLIWISKLYGRPLKMKVSGSDLVPTLLQAAAKEGRSVFVLGGKEDAARKAAENIKARYSGLVMAGALSPSMGFEKKPELVFVNHGDPDSADSFTACLNDEQGYKAFAPYSGTRFDLLRGEFDYIADPKPIEKKPIVSKASRLVSELIAAAERLLRICKGMEGKPNKVLQGFVRDINKLSDDMEKYT